MKNAKLLGVHVIRRCYTYVSYHTYRQNVPQEAEANVETNFVCNIFKLILQSKITLHLYYSE